MSDLIQRKRQINELLSNKDVCSRLLSLCDNNKNKADSFKANLLNIAMDTSLISCSVQSIIKCALDIASLKLPLSKQLGKVYIVPRKKKDRITSSYITEAETMIGYKGWLELAKRAKLAIKSYIVFKCDKYSLEVVNGNEVLNFAPDFDTRDESNAEWIKNNLRGVIVIIKDTKLNETYIHFVSANTLNKISKCSDSVKNGKYSAYSDWLSEMYQAKAIKYIVSKSAMTETLGEAVYIDNLSDNQDFNMQDNNQLSTENLNKLINENFI